MNLFLNKISNKQLIVMRISIYLIGFLFILAVVYANTFHQKKEVFFFTQSSSDSLNLFVLNTSNKFTDIEIEMKLKNMIQVEKLEARITRAPSSLFRETNNQITEKVYLESILFENNESKYPNGSILKKNNSFFLVEKGLLRKFEYENEFEKLGFNKNQVHIISDDEFNKFEQGKSVSIKNNSDYPSGLIIKSGTNYFITGDDRLYPIFSEKLIFEIWKDFSYIETNDISKEKMAQMSCSIFPENIVKCETNLNQIEFQNGDAYPIFIYGIPNGEIEELSATLIKFPNKESILKDFKKMLW